LEGRRESVEEELGCGGIDDSLLEVWGGWVIRRRVGGGWFGRLGSVFLFLLCTSLLSICCLFFTSLLAMLQYRHLLPFLDMVSPLFSSSRFVVAAARILLIVRFPFSQSSLSLSLSYLMLSSRLNHRPR